MEAPMFDARAEDIVRYPRMGEDADAYMVNAESEDGSSSQIDGEEIVMD